MAGEIIRPSDLTTERTSPVASEYMVVDNGVTVAKSTISDVVKAGRPAASQAEAEAGTDPSKAMTPLTTKQAINALGDLRFASVAQGALATSAVQSVVGGAEIGVDNTDPRNPIVSYIGSGVSDGDKGDIIVSAAGATWNVADGFTSIVIRTVATRADLKALNTSRWSHAYLSEAGRSGLFMRRSGSIPISDPAEGVYLLSDTVGFYWERADTGLRFDVLWFGAKLDNSTDDTMAFQSTIALAAAHNGTPYGQRAEVYCEPGHIVKITGQLNLSGTGMRVNIRSLIFYYNTTGYCWFLNETQPAGASSYWDIYLEGGYNVPGTGGPLPATYDPGGTTFFACRAMTFSRVQINQIAQFTYCAIMLDGRGITFPSNNQVIQHNTFILGQIASNGYGLWLQSLDAATSSVQANRFDVQNIYGNWTNILDGGVGYIGSNSNTYNINAMDNETEVGIDTWCSFNKWYVGFTGQPGTSIRLTGASADFSRFDLTNNTSTDIVINLNGPTGKHNTIECAPPSILPSSQSVTNGVEYENVYGCSIAVSVPAVGSGSYQMMLTDPAGGVTTIGPSSGGGFATFPVIKHGWKWRVFTTAGTVTYGSAVITAA